MKTKSAMIRYANRFSQRSMKRAIAFSAFIGLFACKAENAPEQVVLPLMEERMQALTDRKLIEVRITPPHARGEDRRNVELAGLITALFESGLADLDDVVPHVKGSTVSPAFTPRITKGVPVWTAELSINAPPAEHLEVQMLLCSDEQICGALTATSSRARPELAVASLLGEVSSVL